jgi:hypothetical protein
MHSTESEGFRVLQDPRETPIIEMAGREEHRGSSSADGRLWGDEDSLVHDSRRTQIVCVDDAKKKSKAPASIHPSGGGNNAGNLP